MIYLWDFGDGLRSTDENPVHTYKEVGDYQITLTTTDPDGLVDTASTTYSVYRRPTADFVWSPLYPNQGGPINFMNRSTTPNTTNREVSSFAWTFGSSGNHPTVANPPPFTASEGGPLEVTLSVSDMFGMTDSRTQVVEVAHLPPSVDIASIAPILWGETWTPTTLITARSTGNATCRWDWGDSTSRVVYPCDNTSSRVEKVYDRPGVYTARLSITNSAGATNSSSIPVTVLRRETILLVTGAASASTNGDVVVTARLADRLSGRRPISGRMISFASESTSSSASTNSSGAAQAAIAFTGNVSNSAQVSFAGDDLYLASADEALFYPSDLQSAPSLELVSAAGNRGRNFTLGILSPFYESRYDPTPFELHFSSSRRTIANIDVPSLNLQLAAEVIPGQTTRVELPEAAQMNANAVVQHRRGISISSPFDVTVQLGNNMEYASDFALLIPDNALGTDYVVPAYGIDYTLAGIVAAENNTLVTVIPSAELRVHNASPIAAGQTVQFTLQALDSLQLVSATGDLTGTQITSNRPISVQGGVACVRVPAHAAFCNQIFEQIPPTSTWGREFALVSFAGRTVGEFIRIIPAKDDTEIRLDGNVIASDIDRGEFHQIDMASGQQHFVQTSSAVLIVQISKGALAQAGGGSIPVPDAGVVDSATNGQIAEDQPYVDQADPTMMIVPPINQFLPNARVTTSLHGFAEHTATYDNAFTNYLTLVAPSNSLGTILLDGEALTGVSWSQISTTPWATSHLILDRGQHEIRNTIPNVQMGLFTYGWRITDAYGYPAEMRLTRINDSCDGSTPTPGDAVDNDCDDRTDEELANLADDDGDGEIDEDLALELMPVAPRAHSIAYLMDEDRTLDFFLSATDPNGESLTFELPASPAFGALYRSPYSPGSSPLTLPLTNSGGALRYQPPANTSGIVTLPFRAFDGGLYSSIATTTITIQAVNDPPVISTAPIVTTVNEDSLFQHQFSFTDVDPGQLHVFRLAQGPSNATVSPCSGTLNWTPTNEQVGPHAFTVTVTDCLGTSATTCAAVVDSCAGAVSARSFTLTAVDVNDAPTFTTNPLSTGTPG